MSTSMMPYANRLNFNDWYPRHFLLNCSSNNNRHCLLTYNSTNNRHTELAQISLAPSTKTQPRSQL